MQYPLNDICNGHNLSVAETEALFDDVFSGKLNEAQLAGILIALKMKGEVPSEIEGAARAMMKAATPFPRPANADIGDIVGTGGDGQQTINVSTTAALIAAGAGLKIAKHGNKGVSSKSGASDLLTTLGVDIRLPPAESARLLEETGFAFCFAQLYHPAMRFAGPVRASLKVRTLFNILGPLTNPAHADFALIGVYSPTLLEPVAQTLQQLGVKRGFVVHGTGLDEVAVHAETQAIRLFEDGRREPVSFRPEDFGVATRHPLEAIRGGDPTVNAGITKAILAGGGTEAQKDFVAANLTLLLMAGGLARTLPDAVALARQSMASGVGLKTLEAHQAYTAARQAGAAQ